jgi:hypothetical protein
MKTQLTIARPSSVAEKNADDMVSLSERLYADAKDAAGIVRRVVYLPHASDAREKAIADGDRLVADGQFERLFGELIRAHAPATMRDLGPELARLVGAFPNAGRNDLAIYATMLAEDVAAARPTRDAVSAACRRLRRSSKFLPTISEILETLGQSQLELNERMDLLAKLPEALPRARDEHVRRLESEKKSAEEYEVWLQGKRAEAPRPGPVTASSRR